MKDTMKHGVSLPAFMAPASPAPAAKDDARAVHPPFFTASMVLSPLVWPVGVVMGLAYLCLPRWRSAGTAMLVLGLLSAMIGWVVYVSLR
jgi:hypothetical protein